MTILSYVKGIAIGAVAWFTVLMVWWQGVEWLRDLTGPAIQDLLRI